MAAWCRPRPRSSCPGPIASATSRSTVEAFVTSKTPVGTLRAPGRFEANFFRERLIDMVARDLGLDPMEFRRKNLINEAELPFHTGKLVPYEPETDFDTGDYHATFERALTEIGWDEKKSLQGKLIDGRYHGLAAVPFVESGGSGKENCRGWRSSRTARSPSMSARRCWGRGSRPRSRRSPPIR